MELQELVKIFEEALNKEGKETINENTQFKECEHWDSLSAFSISSILFEKYNIKLRGIQIRKCDKIIDLYNLINC